MVTITKIYYPPLFMEGSYVGFDLSDGSHYEGEIIKSDGYYLDIDGANNDILFNKLGIRDINKFTNDIVGYYNGGNWPFVRSLVDLRKILYALSKYKSDHIPEDKKVIINDDEENKPFTLNIKRSNGVKLDFKI